MITIRVTEAFRLCLMDWCPMKAFNCQERALCFRNVTQLRLAFWALWHADTVQRRFYVQADRVLDELKDHLADRGVSWAALVDVVFSEGD